MYLLIGLAMGGDYYTCAIAGLPMLFTLSLGQIVATE
jgi:hypothetical protein